MCVYTIEHISRFLTQYGEAAAEETHRVRLFLLSLSGLAFTWFALLPPNSINDWDDLEKRFHKYFLTGIHEMRLADLIMIEQRNDQSVPEYIQRFRDIMKTQCFSLNLMMASLLSWRFKEFYLYSKKNILPKSLNVLGR